MPLYEYECSACGPFEAWRPMSEAAAPSACPGCGQTARRALARPALGMDSTRRRLHGRNERAAHEPSVVRRETGHGHGHAHGSPDPRLRRLVGDKHAHVSARPWTVGH